MKKLVTGIGHHQQMHHFTDSNNGYVTLYLKQHSHTTTAHRCQQKWIGSSCHTEQLPFIFKTLTDVET